MAFANDAVWISVLPDMSKFGPQMAKGASRSADTTGKTLGSRMASGMGKTLKYGGAAAAAGAAAAIGTALYKGFNRLQGIDQAQAKLRGLGHSAKGVQGIMDNALASVKGTAFGLDAAASTAAGAVAAGVKPGKQLERNLKLVADTATIAGVGMDEMGAIFNKVASSDMIQGDVLAQLGDQGIPVLQMLSKEMGVSAAEVRKLASEGKVDFATFQNAMEAGLGGAAQESGKTFSGALANTQAAMGRLGAVVLGPIFEKIPGILEGMIGKIDALGPTAEKIGAALGSAFAFVGDVLAANVMPRLQVFGGFLRDDVLPVAMAVGGWMRENAELLKMIATFVGAATAAYVVYSTTVRIVAAATAAWAAIQKILNTQLKLNPIGMVVTALFLLGAALVLAYKKSDTFRTIVDKAWAGIKNAVSSAWNGFIKPALRAMSNYITNQLMPVVRQLWRDVVQPVFRLIGKIVKDVWHGVVKPVFKLWWAYIRNVLIPVIRFLFDKVVRPYFVAMGRAIKTVWVNVIRPVFGALRSFIMDKVVPGFRKGVETIGKVWDGLKSAARKPVQFVVDTVYNNGIRKVFNTVAKALGAKAALPHVSMGGSGGPPKGTTARALGGAGRIPKRAMASAMGGPVDWAKNIAGKGKKWVTGKMGGMVDGLLSKVGDSPWAKLAGSAARKAASMAADWLGDKAGAAQAKAKTGKMGKVGKAGRVLPAGSYRIGMPYLGYPGHYGADYPAGMGTPVFSPWPGRVTATYDLPGSNPYNNTPYRSYGRVVKVAHDNGLSTLYAHLSDRIGSTGRIAAGQQLGTVGTNGNSSGPHLHFEAMRGTGRFNPASLGIFDNGGWLKPGMGGVNLGTKPEPVFNPRQWDTLRRVVAQSESAALRSTLVSGVSAPASRGRGGLSDRDISRIADAVASGAYEGAYDGVALRETNNYTRGRAGSRWSQ